MNSKQKKEIALLCQVEGALVHFVKGYPNNTVVQKRVREVREVYNRLIGTYPSPTDKEVAHIKRKLQYMDKFFKEVGEEIVTVVSYLLMLAEDSKQASTKDLIEPLFRLHLYFDRTLAKFENYEKAKYLADKWQWCPL